MSAETDALAALDTAALARDAAAALRVPSVTGDERPVLELLAETAAALGLEPDLHRHDLAALRRHPGHPGEEAPRTELWGLTATRPGGPRRICLNGHVDVVDPGTEPWRHGPWSGAVDGGELHGRGAADMKAAVVAALHAAAAVDGPTVVVQCVSSEEDGGLGTFAELERDARFDAALIPEPTAFDVVCAQAGALTFRGVIPGRAAHAAHRLEGRSAIDRYVAVHAALAEHERSLNAAVEHPLMRRLELPYPLLVGRVSGGRVVQPGPRSARVRGAPRRPGRRRPRTSARGARGRRGRGARRRRGARGDLLDGRQLRARGDAARPPLGRPGGRRVRRRAGPPGGARRRAVGSGHAPLHRPRHPVHDGRHARHRAARTPSTSACRCASWRRSPARSCGC